MNPSGVFFARSGTTLLFVHPSGEFFVYSSVSHGFGVPLFLGDLGDLSGMFFARSCAVLEY